MNSLTMLARLPKSVISPQLRSLHLSAIKCSTSPSTRSIKNVDPNNYSIPLRPATLDDGMEPYGLWKEAYEKEKAYANKKLALGLIMFSASCAIFYHSGVMDGLWMPNLDNLMEDTKPFGWDKEGRKTV